MPSRMWSDKTGPRGCFDIHGGSFVIAVQAYRMFSLHSTGDLNPLPLISFCRTGLGHSSLRHLIPFRGSAEKQNFQP